MLKGFKDFIMRGNVVDLAVGVVIGAAFTGLVTTFTNSFLKPLIQLLSGGTGINAGTWSPRQGVIFDWAGVVNAVITFLLTAAVLYFLVVFPMNKLAERRRRGEEPPPAAPGEEVKLLTEIRDALIGVGHPDHRHQPSTVTGQPPAAAQGQPPAGQQRGALDNLLGRDRRS